MAEPLRAFWCRVPSRPNVGDALTPWIIDRLTGTYPRFVRYDDPRDKVFVTGSIIALAGPAVTVWGAGIMAADDPVCPQARLPAVRGPLTAARARAAGAPAPDALGDPAMLLPRLYRPVVVERARLGVALHFSDRPRLEGRLQLPPGTRLIDMQDLVEEVIDALHGCDLVASSSLHGLVVAHAYGVPATWIEFRPLPSGDGSKFRDHLRTVGSHRDNPLRVDSPRLQENNLWRHAVIPQDHFDREALWQVCPFLPG